MDGRAGRGCPEPFVRRAAGAVGGGRGEKEGVGIVGVVVVEVGGCDEVVGRRKVGEGRASVSRE